MRSSFGGGAGQSKLNLCLGGQWEWGAESETKLKPLTFWVESRATYVWVASSTVCAVQAGERGSCLISSTAKEGLPPSAEFPLCPAPLSPVRQSHCLAYVGKTQRWRWNICVFNFTCAGVCECVCVSCLRISVACSAFSPSLLPLSDSFSSATHIYFSFNFQFFFQRF